MSSIKHLEMAAALSAYPHIEIKKSTNSSFCRLKPLSKYDKYWCFKNSSYLQT